MKSYYDALYKENEHYWGRLPSPLSLFVVKHCKKGRLLDLGCGQGPDALFFAMKGLQVTALDISPVAISDLQKHAKELQLHIDTREGDMRELPNEDFNVIFSRMALQMIEPVKRNAYLQKLGNIYPNALHAHVIPIQGACFGEDFICENNLLKESYKDWNIVFYEEAWTISRAINKNDEPFLMREARILAKQSK